MKPAIQILLVEDSPGDALLVKEALKESVYRDAKLVQAESLHEAISLSSQSFLPVLLDLGLPDSDGLETVRKIYEFFEDGVVIVLTGLDDDRIAVETLREGAQNYLNKNEIDHKILERTIRFSLERHRIIQQLKSVDKELLESKYFLEQAQAIAQLGSWVYDINQQTLSWSSGIYKIFGIENSEEASLDLFYSIAHPDDQAYLKLHQDIVMKGNDGDSMHFRFIRQSDQQIRYAISEYRYEMDVAGSPVKIFGIIKDITEQKLAEEEREKFINEITQRHKDLEQFTYIVSHDLRLPVANILGFAEILKYQQLSAEEKDEFIGLIINSVMKLDEVVKDLNQVLQIRKAIQENREWVAIHELIENITDSIRQIVQAEQVSIHTDFSQINELFSIKSYLYSIFYNLISNSIKYRLKDQPPVIYIKSELKEGKIIITYRDNGSGIDLNKHGQDIFGLYKRFHSQVEGKGMGLYMVKTQVESLGGTIRLESEPNKGVKFTLEFDTEEND